MLKVSLLGVWLQIAKCAIISGACAGGCAISADNAGFRGLIAHLNERGWRRKPGSSSSGDPFSAHAFIAVNLNAILRTIMPSIFSP